MMRPLVILLIVCSSSVASEYKEENGVLVLTKDTFESAVKEYRYVLVEFYAPWCGHCKALEPEYAKAANLLKEEKSPIKLAKIDATVEMDLAKNHNLQGYPTLVFYRDGERVEYESGHKAADIILWLKKKSGDPAEKVESVEEAKKMIEKDQVVAFGFFKNQESSAAKAYLKVAMVVESVPFKITSTDALFKEYNVKDDTVVLFRKFDDGRLDLAKDLTEDKIKTFVSINSLPYVIDFDTDVADRLFGGEVKYHLLLFANKKSEDCQKHVDTLRSIAPDFKGKVFFVHINPDVEEHRNIMEFFNVQEEEIAAVRMMYLNESVVKYKPETKELTADVLKKFIQETLDGKMQPHFMSQEIPVDWDSKPVKVLVGKNFNAVARDKQKNVFVEFYAPWCGHCKKLAPIWDKLGSKFKDSPDTVIAKMDSTANEVAGVQISSYPTLMYFPKGDGDIVPYHGARTLEALTKFVESGGKVGGGPTEEEVEEVEKQEEIEIKDEQQKDEL